MKLVAGATWHSHCVPGPREQGCRGRAGRCCGRQGAWVLVRLGGGALECTLRGGRGPALQPLCQRKQERLPFARSALWHMEIQERQLEGARQSARAEAPAARR